VSKAQEKLFEPEWEDPEPLQRILETVTEHHAYPKTALLRNAYYFAEKAHTGQFRDSGDPYITHPLAVAQILAELQLDPETVAAGLLHDTLEDCGEFVTRERIKDYFGETVLNLVEGVTKLRFPYRDEPDSFAAKKQEEIRRAAESLRKVLLAMAADLRVMVIKLADRLHNMRTIEALTEPKRKRIATETMHVYAPLAARLGIWQLKWQLEDLAFRELNAKDYEFVAKMLDKTRDVREQELREAMLALKEKTEQAGIKADVTGRPKHIYSIHGKIEKQGLSFDQVYDLLGIRIIVDTEADCYHALGLVHELWKPIPGMFYDYIAKPKANGYRSLHTKVVGPNGDPLEIQIRTQRMHELAEFGVAAHWVYKEGMPERLPMLRQQLFDWSSDAKTSSEFLRDVSEDLFADQVFVFTPKGDVIDLPAGSTPIDFAFRIHSRLGEQLVGARVNARIVPIDYSLQNGDICEILTRQNAQPSLDWLKYVKTSGARSKIRSFLRKLNREENAARGREALERHIKYVGKDPRAYLGEDNLAQIAEAYNAGSAEELLAKVGEGLVTVNSVMSRLKAIVPEPEQPEEEEIGRPVMERATRIAPGGLEGVMTRRARCCNPIPGDVIVGYVTRGRGMMIHRVECPNAIKLQQDDPARLQPVDWEGDADHVYGVVIQINCINRIGLLADVSHIFGEAKTNITGARITVSRNNTALIELAVEVRDTDHLREIMAKIENFSDVLSLQRVMGRKL
jgi:guanosine-3',5'-bis(diphosphate) 3'-pyrophosphohydrolase